MNNRQRLFYERTVKMFVESGCQPLEEGYKPAKTKWNYICSCGTKAQISPNNFKKGCRCHMCKEARILAAAARNRTPVEDVRKYFDGLPEILLNVYRVKVSEKHTRTTCVYECKRGHTVETAFYHFKAGTRCSECAIIEAGDRYRMSVEDVRQVFADNDCELLSEDYVNCDQRLKYKCTCGNISYSYVSAMKRGIKCGCGYTSGPDNPRWKSSISDEERITRRKYPEYREFVQRVMERDDYTCAKCRQRGGKLNVHHILGYAEHPELRTTDSNGITLCKGCHIEFHSIYGLKGFGPDDIDVFLTLKKEANV